MGIIEELGIENISGKYETLEILYDLLKELFIRQNSSDAKERGAAERQFVAATELSSILENIEDEVEDVSLVVKTYAYAYDNEEELKDKFKNDLGVAMSSGKVAFGIAQYWGKRQQNNLYDDWILLAAELGCEEAYQLCGYAFLKKNTDKAIEWFAKAETVGKIDTANIYNWGYIYYSRNLFDAAKPKFVTASVQGQGLASYYLAKMYEYGQGVPANIDQAINLYRIAYQRGVQRAQNDVVRLTREIQNQHVQQNVYGNTNYARLNNTSSAGVYKNEYTYVKRDDEKPWLKIFLIIIAVLLMMNILRSCAIAIGSGLENKRKSIESAAVTDKSELVDLDEDNGLGRKLVDAAIVDSSKFEFAKKSVNDSK